MLTVPSRDLCLPVCQLFTKYPPHLGLGLGVGGERPQPCSPILFYLLKSCNCPCAQAPALEESFVLLELLLFPQGQAAEGRTVHAKNSLEVLVGEVVLGPEKG